MNRRPRALLGVCGGIAAYKTAELVRLLRARDVEVRCALTRAAEAFVAPLTLEVLSGRPVHRQEYLAAGGGGEEAHVEAAAWADVVCVVPATAHLLARLALGLADDFLTTTALVFTGPVVLAPAMHTAMWSHEAVRTNVETLRRRGVRILGPVEGELASGERGMGRMVEPAEIAAAVAEIVEPRGAPTESRVAGEGRRLDGLRVLVTAGPTREPIDPVRYLSNRSSGKMGFAVAAEAARRGARTWLVAGPVALPTPAGVERIDVTTALEMQDAVYERAPRADLVVMAAAVSDYRPWPRAPEKLKRAGGVPRFELEENPDILAGLPAVAPGAVLVGFAAETGIETAEAEAKLARKGADFLVANDVSRRDVGFDSDHNEVVVYRSSGPPIALSRRPKSALAADLLDLWTEALRSRERTAGPAA